MILCTGEPPVSSTSQRSTESRGWTGQVYGHSPGCLAALLSEAPEATLLACCALVSQESLMVQDVALAPAISSASKPA